MDSFEEYGYHAVASKRIWCQGGQFLLKNKTKSRRLFVSSKRLEYLTERYYRGVARNKISTEEQNRPEHVEKTCVNGICRDEKFRIESTSRMVLSHKAHMFPVDCVNELYIYI